MSCWRFCGRPSCWASSFGWSNRPLVQRSDWKSTWPDRAGLTATSSALRVEIIQKLMMKAIFSFHVTIKLMKLRSECRIAGCSSCKRVVQSRASRNPNCCSLWNIRTYQEKLPDWWFIDSRFQPLDKSRAQNGPDVRIDFQGIGSL